jgi:hypothetical protein
MEAPFRVLGLTYPDDVQASVGSVYVDEFRRGYFPDSCPPSSHIIFTFPAVGNRPRVKIHWMDGGIQPERPDELGPNEVFGDNGNGVLFIGSKGKMMCGTYGVNPQLLPTSRTAEVKVPEKYKRVPEGSGGHYKQWVEGCIAGYGKNELSSSFDIAGPLTEMILIGNLALRSHDIRTPRQDRPNQFNYPGRDIKLLWDAQNVKVTNFDEANQFVKRTYRQGWSL